MEKKIKIDPDLIKKEKEKKKKIIDNKEIVKK